MTDITKVTDKVLIYPRWTRSYTGSGNPPDLTIGRSSLTLLGSKTFGDYVPAYKSKIRRGRSATSTFTGSKRDCRLGYPGHAKYEFISKNGLQVQLHEQIGLWSSQPLLPASPLTISLTESENLALMKFVKKINKTQTTFQGGVFLGELKETLHAIRNPAIALRKGFSDYLNDVKKHRRLPKNRIPKAIGGTWLEYAFGWKPLINDIDEAAKALADNANRFTRHFERVYAEAKDELEPTFSRGTQTCAGGMVVEYEIVNTRKAMTIFRGAVLLASDSPQFMNRANLGFSASNFVPTIWELIPYSFLADYFTNIGDILEGWSAQTVSMAWKNRTYRRTSETTCNIVRLRPFSVTSTWKPEPVSVDFRPEQWSTSYNLVDRANYSGTLIPSFRFTIPGLGTKWINMSALVAQARKTSFFLTAR